MTKVTLDALETAFGGPASVDDGTITAQYWAGRGPVTQINGEKVTFPREMRMKLTQGRPVEPLELIATRGVRCVRWEIKTLWGASVTLYTEIPDVETIGIGDLQQVDPVTFEPTGEVVAAWEAVVAAVQADRERADEASVEAVASAANAGVSAEAAGSDAATAARSAIDAGVARDEAVTAAGTASTAAGDAEAARAGAVDAQGVAESAQAAASASETAAVAARTAAESAQAGAQVAEESATAAQTAGEDAATVATTARTGAEAAEAGAEVAQAAAELARDETIVSVDGPAEWTGHVVLAQHESQSAFLTRRLTGDVTLTPAPGTPGQAYTCTLLLSQDAAGDHEITVVGAGTSYGVPIALSPSANATDLLHLMWTGSVWIAMMGAAQVAVPTSWVVA